MVEKRPIDRRREAAMSVEVGIDGDNSPITGMITIGGTLYIVKSSGIYEIRLADEIDPQRVNPNIPNTQRRVLRLGSDSELVGKTLLTARQLFDPKFLQKDIDCDGAVSLSFDALKDLGSMAEILAEITEVQDKVFATKDFKAKPDGSLVLPSIENIEVLCRTFAQKADHTLQSLLSIIRNFYGDGATKVWFESFSGMVEHQFGSKDPYSKFLKSALPFLKFVRDMRNAVEHPGVDQRIVVHDFTLGTDGKIVPPIIEVVHKRSPQPPLMISRFMSEVTKHISQIFETTIAFLCDRHLTPASGFNVAVVEVPPERRREKHVRFGYGITTDTGVILFS